MKAVVNIAPTALIAIHSSGNKNDANFNKATRYSARLLLITSIDFRAESANFKLYIMRFKLFILTIFLAFFSSCVSVRVVSDYDKAAPFNTYRTFAFYKTGIDKAKISDLDKKRILRNLEAGMITKGFQKSSTPDVLVSFFTKEKERVNVYNNGFGMGWGWNPWWWGGNMSTVTTSTQGVLYIDLIDAKTKQLVWQGKGSGSINFDGNIERKEARIAEFVREILAQYPPGTSTK